MTRDEAPGSVPTPDSPNPAGNAFTPGAAPAPPLRRRAAAAAARPPDAAGMDATLQRLRARGHATGAALRVLRQLVMERLVVLDCEQGAPLQAVTAA
jgi:glutamate-ammonia-ligase adenylyltransferase